MTKKTAQLLINLLFLLILASCKQTAGDDPIPVCPPVPVLPGLEIQEIKIDWVQYDTYLRDYLYGGHYTWDLMIRDFMCDNLFIIDTAMAEKIIKEKIDPWIVPAIVPPAP